MPIRRAASGPAPTSRRVRAGETADVAVAQPVVDEREEMAGRRWVMCVFRARRCRYFNMRRFAWPAPADDGRAVLPVSGHGFSLVQGVALIFRAGRRVCRSGVADNLRRGVS